MKKVQFDALSESLSKAINPAARKREATARILEQIEPLPIFGKQIPTPSSSEDSPLIDATGTGVNLTPVSVDTVSKLIPVSKTRGYDEAKKTGYLKVPNEILDLLLPTLTPPRQSFSCGCIVSPLGFNQTTCTVGMTGLMRACNMSEILAAGL